MFGKVYEVKADIYGIRMLYNDGPNGDSDYEMWNID